MLGKAREGNLNIRPVRLIDSREQYDGPGKNRKYQVACLTIPGRYGRIPMELRHLRYFAAVAEEQNITRAAARLNVSQPPLSRQIRDLEDELGVALLERGAKSVRLTEAGRVFLDETRAVLARVEEARKALQAFKEGCTGEIHVGYAPSLMVELLPHGLREFQKSSPSVRVTLHDFSSAEMLAGLRGGTLDVALTIEPARQAMTGLVFHKLREYGVRIAMHPGHILAAGPAVDFTKAAGEKLICYTRKDYPEYHEWLERLFGSAGLHPQPAEEHDSSSSLIAAVESGRGVALVPQSFVCFAGARLKLLPLDPPPADFPVGVVRRKGPVDRKVADFIAAVQKPVPARPAMD